MVMQVTGDKLRLNMQAPGVQIPATCSAFTSFHLFHLEAWLFRVPFAAPNPRFDYIED